MQLSVRRKSDATLREKAAACGGHQLPSPAPLPKEAAGVGRRQRASGCRLHFQPPHSWAWACAPGLPWGHKGFCFRGPLKIGARAWRCSYGNSWGRAPLSGTTRGREDEREAETVTQEEVLHFWGVWWWPLLPRPYCVFNKCIIISCLILSFRHLYDFNICILWLVKICQASSPHILSIPLFS